MRKEQTKLFTAQKMPCNFEAENALDDFAVGTMVGEPRGVLKAMNMVMFLKHLDLLIWNPLFKSLLA